MHPEILNRRTIPAYVGAGLCLFFIKSGVLFLFFLVPLGFLVYRYGREIAWTGLSLAILGNAVITAMETVVRSVPLKDAVWDFLYFMVMALIFVWIIAPPQGLTPKMSGAIRLIIGSSAGALLLTFLLFRLMASPGFLDYLDAWIRMFTAPGRYDAAGASLLQVLTAEAFLTVMKAVVLRGGSLVTCVFIFFFCRQISIILANLNIGNFRRNAAGGQTASGAATLSLFHVNPEVIWVFSLSLFLVVTTRILKLEIPEIFLWNVLILCIMLYFAQGLGILQFFLKRPATPHFMRFLAGILLVVLFFSPVINAVVFGGLVFLGIAENWVPMRAPKQNEPPSTPEAGDDGSEK